MFKQGYTNYFEELQSLFRNLSNLTVIPEFIKLQIHHQQSMNIMSTDEENNNITQESSIVPILSTASSIHDAAPFDEDDYNELLDELQHNLKVVEVDGLSDCSSAIDPHDEEQLQQEASDSGLIPLQPHEGSVPPTNINNNNFNNSSNLFPGTTEEIFDEVLQNLDTNMEWYITSEMFEEVNTTAGVLEQNCRDEEDIFGNIYYLSLSLVRR